jgi:Tfp pilus assembly protein FimT
MRNMMRLGQQGVTFVELLLVMGLLGIFLVIITTIFTSTLDIQSQTDSYNATVSDGRFIMSRLNYDIARASAVTTPAALGGSGGTLVMTVNASTYTYALSGNNLQLTAGANSGNLNGNGTTVSNLSFQRIGNSGGKDTIRYSFKLTSTTLHEGRADTQTFTSTAVRR